MVGRAWIATGSITAALGVTIGAFGAHGLEDTLRSLLDEAANVARNLANFETAVRYQMSHAVGMVLAGLVAGRGCPKWSAAAGWLFLAGIVLFSGSLYALVFGAPSFFGAVAPFGGLAMIAGWAALAIAGWRSAR